MYITFLVWNRRYFDFRHFEQEPQKFVQNSYVCCHAILMCGPPNMILHQFWKIRKCRFSLHKEFVRLSLKTAQTFEDANVFTDFEFGIELMTDHFAFSSYPRRISWRLRGRFCHNNRQWPTFRSVLPVMECIVLQIFYIPKKKPECGAKCLYSPQNAFLVLLYGTVK